MYLTEDGFFQLIGAGDRLAADPGLRSGLDPNSWPDLWDDFLEEAARFDDNALVRLFGDAEPARRPPLDKQLLTRRDRVLIGEFIRRHHPRLAHKIAVLGVPGVGSNRLSVLPHETVDLADLCGFVARSHGSPLRQSLPYLKAHFHLRDFRGIHAVYLMVLLRIDDYLQIQADRAPGQRLLLSALHSPYSEGEWDAHAAIHDITWQDDDPECFFVDARPTDVRTYLKLKNLLFNIQSELDIAWAVLGETYGRIEPLAQLALNVRRIRSNLGDIAEFAKTVEYIPRHAVFDAVPDLLKLLIQPLYGSDVNYGARELIQNAVDACNERRNLEQRRVLQSAETIAERDNAIVLSFDQSGDSGWVLTLRDHGVGMTEDTICNYFLKAGASYRYSEAWRHLHEDQGHPTLLRSGRFGIGVLSCFLLGTELNVTSRHVRSERGVSFHARLDSEAIELRHVDCPIGTTMTIRLRPEAAAQLRDLMGGRRGALGFAALPDQIYLLDSPVIAMRISGRDIRMGPRWPSCGQEKPDWRRFHPAGYKEVQWTYALMPLVDRFGAMLACNGIAVAEPRRQSILGDHALWRADAGGFRIDSPVISVFDREGNLPLNLTRTRLASDRLPFQKELIEDVCKALVLDMVNDALVETWLDSKGALVPPYVCLQRGRSAEVIPPKNRRLHDSERSRRSMARHSHCGLCWLYVRKTSRANFQGRWCGKMAEHRQGEREGQVLGFTRQRIPKPPESWGPSLVGLRIAIADEFLERHRGQLGDEFEVLTSGGRLRGRTILGDVAPETDEFSESVRVAGDAGPTIVVEYHFTRKANHESEHRWLVSSARSLAAMCCLWKGTSDRRPVLDDSML